MRAKPLPERGEIAHLLESCTIRQIAAFYGVTTPTLYSWMEKLEIAKKGRSYKTRIKQGGQTDGR